MDTKIKLHGYNNLAKALSISIYDICYAKTETDKRKFIKRINERYNAGNLSRIMVEVAEMIGATILNLSKQDYEPHGASVNLLIAEDSYPAVEPDISCNRGKFGAGPDMLLAHLDKSHIAVHTYPEFAPKQPIATFRVDIDVVTCGNIIPLNTLNHLIRSFESDVVIIDYKVRGFARLEDGTKIYIDHELGSIQEFIDEETLADFTVRDLNHLELNLYNTKMMRDEIDLRTQRLGGKSGTPSPKDKERIRKLIRQEMIDIIS